MVSGAYAALRAGKHVLCEKPLAANATEAQQMAATARETGLVLMEAFHYRYHPLAMRMHEILESGALGTIRRIEAYMCIPVLRPGDIRYRFDLAGGATMDAGCYAVHMVRFLSGAEPEVIDARARLLTPQIDRAMDAELRFADGRTAHIGCSLLSTALLKIWATVIGDEGRLDVINPVLPHYFHRLMLKSAGNVEKVRVAGDTTYTYQLRGFVAAVRNGVEPPTGWTDAVANMRVIDAIYAKAGLQSRTGS